jgi:predicted metal-dependent hydrolase
VPKPTPPAQSRSSLVAGQHLSYLLRVSPRARVVRLVIRPGSGLEVVVPRGTPQARVEEVLADKARWIAATLQRVAREALSSQPRCLEDGQALSVAGRTLRLALYEGAPAGRYRAVLEGETLALRIHDFAQETIRRALEAWYRQQARSVFDERLAACNAAYGFTFGRVSIKEQKSRWGSCSRRGNLNFNWRLLLAPLPVLDYVVIHELCHLKELSHSARFWALVARACPDYAVRRRWLRQHGRTLVL